MSSAMHMTSPPLSFARTFVVGSVSSAKTLASLDPSDVACRCDILEIRVDGLCAEGTQPERAFWGEFRQIPLLFTVRRSEEGGLARLDASQRMILLETCLPDASAIDIEAASIPEMRGIIEKAAGAGVPWIASYHDFQGMPDESDLLSSLQRAKDAGAAVFKWAAMVHTQKDLVRLADFQQLDHGIPVASMGMGPLAVVSRLLCAQYGSILNYGYLGTETTAPGQWDAGSLKQAIGRLPALRGLNPR